MYTLRALLAAILALMAALVIMYMMLMLRAYFAGRAASKDTTAPLSNVQKLDILASLKASSSPTISYQRVMLKDLSGQSSSSVADQQKLNILRSLQRR